MEVKKTEHTEIIERIRNALEPWVSDIDLIDGINEETNLVADLGLDSIGILQLFLEIEKDFNISIKNSELDSQLLSKVGNIVSMIQEKLDENN